MGIKFTAGVVTVDSVVKTVQQAVTDLENIALAKSKAIDARAVQMDALTEKNRIDHNEQQRANRIKQKLVDLIS